MADDPKPRALVEVVPSRMGDLSALGSAHAPFIYFDSAPTLGFQDGVVSVTLEAVRRFAGPENTVVLDRVVVAHLRMGLAAAEHLRAALGQAIAMSKPPSDAVSH